MNIRKHVQRFYWVGLVCLVLILTGCAIGHAQTINSYNTFLPYIFGPPGPVPIFGAEVSSLSNSNVLFYSADAPTTWLRRNGLLWLDVQPNGPNEWNWTNSNISSLEQDLIKANFNHMKVILIIRGTPGWAEKYLNTPCGPMRRETLGNFAAFMNKVVQRYSIPPYNVLYYEIWNEPDTAPNMVDPQGAFGCWGDNTDRSYFGGGYYAEMLQAIYPGVKAANVSAQVVLGGLLLDCDPRNPGSAGYCANPDKAIPPKFFEGVLQAGGGNYFDIVSFHGYPSISIDYPLPISNEISFSTWSAHGGVVQGKINYLQEKMAAYGINKPIIHSEVALLNSSNPALQVPVIGFENAKADYLVWMYARNMSQGLLGTVWYTMNGPGWRGSGLLDKDQFPTSAYKAYKFMIQELSNAAFEVNYINNPLSGVDEFIFSTKNKYIQLYVPTDGTSHIMTPPSEYLGIFDRSGNVIPVLNGTITIDQPVYIEIPK